MYPQSYIFKTIIAMINAIDLPMIADTSVVLSRCSRSYDAEQPGGEADRLQLRLMGITIIVPRRRH